jgi:hypothetical protein
MSNESMKTLAAIQALTLRDLEEASDEQIRAEFVEDGQDPDLVAREVAESLDSVVAEFMRNRVAATKAVRKATESPIERIRPSIQKIKEIVQRAFEVEPSLATAYRKGTKQSDNDWISTFDDLVLLGKIDPDEHVD